MNIGEVNGLMSWPVAEGVQKAITGPIWTQITFPARCGSSHDKWNGVRRFEQNLLLCDRINKWRLYKDFFLYCRFE